MKEIKFSSYAELNAELNELLNAYDETLELDCESDFVTGTGHPAQQSYDHVAGAGLDIAMTLLEIQVKEAEKQ